MRRASRWSLRPARATPPRTRRLSRRSGAGCSSCFPTTPTTRRRPAWPTCARRSIACSRRARPKYDIRMPDGTFAVKHWSPKNLPVLSDAGEVLYILHRVEDVTELVQASEAGEQLRDRTTAMEREVINRSRELHDALQELRDANAKLGELDASAAPTASPRATRSSCATTAPASIWRMRAGCSRRFSGSMMPRNSKAPASGSPPCSASSTATAGASGRTPPRSKAQRFSSRCRLGITGERRIRVARTSCCSGRRRSESVRPSARPGRDHRTPRRSPRSTRRRSTAASASARTE